MIQLVLATQDDVFAQRVRAVIDGAVEARIKRAPQQTLLMDARRAAATMVDDPRPPDVIVLGPALPDGATFALAHAFDETHPEVTVVVIAEPTTAVLEEALRAGVREVVGPDEPDEALRKALERAVETAGRRRDRTVEDDVGVGGRIIATISPKGGAGKTAVATNLAVGLAAQEPGRVALVDLDLHFGDVSSALQLMPEHTISEAATSAAQGHLDAMGLKVLLTNHHSGLYVLCAPETPADGDLVTGEQCAAILNLLAHEFDYVVVDTPAGLTEETLAAIEVASDLVFICAMDVATVRAFRKLIEALEALGMTHHARHVVLNRADARVGLEAADVERTLGVPIHVEVPSSRAVPISMNQGVPVMLADGRSPVTRALSGLVSRFVTVDTGGAGLLSKLRSKR